MAMKYHPDVSKEPEAETYFKIVYIAYEILLDPYKRSLYDEILLRKQTETTMNTWQDDANRHAQRYAGMKYEEFEDTLLSKIVFHSEQVVAFLFCFALLCIAFICLALGCYFFARKHFNGAIVLGTLIIVVGSILLFISIKGLLEVFNTWRRR